MGLLTERLEESAAAAELEESAAAAELEESAAGLEATTAGLIGTAAADLDKSADTVSEGSAAERPTVGDLEG